MNGRLLYKKNYSPCSSDNPVNSGQLSAEHLCSALQASFNLLPVLYSSKAASRQFVKQCKKVSKDYQLDITIIKQTHQISATMNIPCCNRQPSQIIARFPHIRGEVNLPSVTLLHSSVNKD